MGRLVLKSDLSNSKRIAENISSMLQKEYPCPTDQEWLEILAGANIFYLSIKSFLENELPEGSKILEMYGKDNE